MIKYIFEALYNLTNNYGATIILISIILSIANSFLAKFFIQISKNEKYRKQRVDNEINEIPKSLIFSKRTILIKKIKYKYSYNEFSEIIHILPLIVQLPILLAVYYFLINYEPIVGVSFGIINDLSAPDNLILGLNILPLLMTFFNLLSSDSFKRKSIQDFVKSSIVAILFLVLLYNMPSSLLIFWTFNNLFLLIRTKLINQSETDKSALKFLFQPYETRNLYVYLIPVFDVIYYWSKEPETFTYMYFFVFVLVLELIIFIFLSLLKKLKIYSTFSVFTLAIAIFMFLNFYKYYSKAFDFISTLLYTPSIKQFYSLLIILILFFFIVVISRVINLKNIRFYKFANTFLIILILIPIISSIINNRGFNFTASEIVIDVDIKNNIDEMISKTDNSKNNDIIFIVLDAYAHKETLAKEYNYDNSGFINFLDSLKFNVFEKTFSNYSITDPSLASILNMNYIHDLNYDGDINKLTSQLINYNKVGDTFRKLGYDYIHFASEWTGNINSVYATKNINTYLKTIPVSKSLDLYLSKSFLPALLNLTISKEEGTTKKIELIEELAKNKQKEYIFAHFMLPHPPYVFNAGGTLSNYNDSEFYNNVWLDKKGYIGQLIYTNYLIKGLLENILKNNEDHPIVIIASDHGSFSTYKNSSDFTDRLVNERMKNFIAIFTNDTKLNSYNDSTQILSPVNIFPLIFNNYFNGNFKIKENKSYYSPYTENNKFEDVTELIKFNTE
jgi:hypothetical protein